MNNKIAVDLEEAFFGRTDNPLGEITGVSKLTSAGVSNALVIAGVVLIFTIIYAGTSMVTAAGNAQQFERARLILISAIIGFGIIAASWFIASYIFFTTTGIGFL